MVNPPSPPLDLAVIGAGPHALTLVTHLLQKRQTISDRFLVFDRWRSQFAVLDIPHRRSPSAAASRSPALKFRYLIWTCVGLSIMLFLKKINLNKFIKPKK